MLSSVFGVKPRFAFSRQLGAERRSIAPDRFSLCSAVIRQRQPGASWPRFTAPWLMSASRAPQPGAPGICSRNTYRTTLRYSAQSSSQGIFLVIILRS